MGKETKSLYDTLKTIHDHTDGSTVDPACEEDYMKLFEDRRVSTCPTCVYGIYLKVFSAVPQDRSIIRIIAKWQRVWLKYCRSPEADYPFQVLRRVEGESDQPPIEIDREKSVSNILDNSLREKGQPIFDQIASTQGVRIYRHVLIDWFLQRYNLKYALQAYDRDSKSWLHKILFALLAIILIVFVSVLGFWPHLPLSQPFLGVVSAVSRKTDFFKSEAAQGSRLGILSWIELLSIIIIFSLILGALLKRIDVKFLFPRLVGTIFIGLYSLVDSAYMWSFPPQLKNPGIVAISMSAFIMSVLFLAWECRLVTKLPMTETIRRAFPIAMYGLLVSIMLALFASDIMGAYFMKPELIAEGGPFNKGLFGGLIYPKVVILFSAVSLLIGILLRAFWEEKTVTEPLS